MTDTASDDKPRVFVSHGKQDAWVANQISRRVKDCGATTFLDESNIKKGDDFKKIIHREIALCTELIALFTPWSAQRFWVWVEVGAAWGHNKRIVAVLYGIEPRDLEELGGSKAILEDINIVRMNEFDDYLAELSERLKGDGNG